MTSLIDRRHLLFVLEDVLEAPELLALEAFSGHDTGSALAIVDAAERVAREQFLPSYGLLDANEPKLENGRVVLPEAVERALEVFREAGFPAMTAMVSDGGLGLPRTYGNAAFLWFQAANISIANYAMLSMSAAELLAHHGSDEQRQRYMQPLLEGRIHGTMALSEPHAGSSLGDITTAARPLADGRYALKGTKMWISGGEHEIGDNIVHLMLARIEGAPQGVRGISLFTVPRKRLDAAGRATAWNHVALAGLNHKMGQRGTVNTILSVGDDGETIGEIVGEPGKGLAAMFTMMNEARIGVAMGAVAHASAGYQYCLAYARDRLQGRHPDSKDPASPQIRLIEHADVRRMLLQQKAAAEGGIALALYLARLADLKRASGDGRERDDAALLLDFLTPVFKAWFSEECLTANYNAMQVLGGAGYTRDHPLEQHYRDNRLNPIHEGTNGIQALDLLGRKATLDGGRAVVLFRDRVRQTARLGRAMQLDDLASGLEHAIDAVVTATARLAETGRVAGTRQALGQASDYMELIGATVLMWMWLEQARVAAAKRAPSDGGEAAFFDGLMMTARHVLAMMLPRATAAAGRIEAAAAGQAEPVQLAMTDAMFG